MRKNALIILLVIVLAIGVYFWYQYQQAMQYTYRISAIKFDTVGIKKTAGSIVFQIENPSALSGELVSADLNMYVNDVFVSKLQVTDKVAIAPKSAFMLPLSFEFSPTHILSIKNVFALEGIADADRTMIAFNGWITVQKGYFKIRIPISINKPYSWYL